jgi:hypothetical protein
LQIVVFGLSSALSPRARETDNLHRSTDHADRGRELVGGKGLEPLTAGV